MKNLAKCTPSEFLKQTNRIRKAVEKWLTDTEILEIRKRMKPLPEIKPGMTKEEQRETIDKQREIMSAQARENLSAMLDAIMVDHPDETLELLALICFVEPEDVDTHTISEYLGAITEMVQDENVISFFTLFTPQARTSGNLLQRA